MLITCPACSAAYTIDDARVGKAGRKVRCSQCQETWFVSPVDAASGFQADPPDAGGADAPGPSPTGQEITPVTPQPGAVRRPPRKPARAPRAASWTEARWMTALAASLVLALPSAVLLRSSIVRAAPQSARVFAAIGLPVNLVGLDLAEVTSGFAEEDAKRVLIVEGTIANPTGRELPVPPIEVVVQSGAGEMLYAWSTEPPRPDLGAAETTRFRIRLASPPPEGRRVAVTFKTRPRADAVASP